MPYSLYPDLGLTVESKQILAILPGDAFGLFAAVGRATLVKRHPTNPRARTVTTAPTNSSPATRAGSPAAAPCHRAVETDAHDHFRRPHANRFRVRPAQRHPGRHGHRRRRRRHRPMDAAGVRRPGHTTTPPTPVTGRPRGRYLPPCFPPQGPALPTYSADVAPLVAAGRADDRRLGVAGGGISVRAALRPYPNPRSGFELTAVTVVIRYFPLAGSTADHPQPTASLSSPGLPTVPQGATEPAGQRVGHGLAVHSREAPSAHGGQTAIPRTIGRGRLLTGLCPALDSARVEHLACEQRSPAPGAAATLFLVQSLHGIQVCWDGYCISCLCSPNRKR